MNKYLLSTVEARTNGKEVSDGDVVNMITKTIKELTEEAENYKLAGNLEEVANINEQKSILEKYLPKMLTVEEIKNIINELDDKSIPSVMKHFKAHYNGLCDMKLVSETVKNL